VGSVTLNDPVPLYGVVPPVAETVQLNGLPAVWPEPQLTVTMSGCGAIATVAVPNALMPFASVTNIGTVYAPLLGATKLVPLLEYGAVPPVAEYEHVNALPAVKPDGQVTVTTKG